MTTKKATIKNEKQQKIYRINKTATHTVYKNKKGQRVPGVTTILGFINKGDALLKWAYECGVEGIDFRKEKDQAADIGTIAHAMAECYINGWELDTSNLSPEDVSLAENAFIKFVTWWDDEGFVLVQSELPLVSETLQVGGTLDILAKDRKGRLVLIDLKTSKYVYAEYKLQTAAYAFIYEEHFGPKRTLDSYNGLEIGVEGGEPISKIIIARIGKKEVGDFEHRTITDRDESLAAFMATIKAKRLFDRVNKF